MDLRRIGRSSNEDDTLGEEEYLEMLSSFLHCISCTSPLEAEKTIQSASEDWVNDSRGQNFVDYETSKPYTSA